MLRCVIYIFPYYFYIDIIYTTFTMVLYLLYKMTPKNYDNVFVYFAEYSSKPNKHG